MQESSRKEPEIGPLTFGLSCPCCSYYLKAPPTAKISPPIRSIHITLLETIDRRSLSALYPSWSEYRSTGQRIEDCLHISFAAELLISHILDPILLTTVT